MSGSATTSFNPVSSPSWSLVEPPGKEEPEELQDLRLHQQGVDDPLMRSFRSTRS